MKVLRFIAVFTALGVPGFAQLASVERPRIDVESYQVHGVLDPELQELTGTATIRFIQLDRQNYAVFDLDRRLRVRDVYLGEEEPLPVRFRQFDVDSTLEVDLSDLGQFDDPVIRVEYAGLVEPENEFDPVLLSVDTYGAFLLEESKWYPMNRVHEDPAVMQLTLTLPADWRIVSSLEQGESVLVDPVARLVDRSLRGPTPGFWGSVIAGDYQDTRVVAIDGTNIEAMTLPRSVGPAQAMSQAAAEYFRYFRDLFGAPSVSTFQMVEIPGANWDARSAPGMLLLPSSALVEDFDEFELARHVATQWFPLTYDVDDPSADAWLAEGLGVFASLNYFQNNLSPADADEYAERTLVRALSYEGNTPLSDVASLPPNSPEYEALAAYKGAFVIRMLEDVMGTEAFRGMLADFDVEFGDRPISTRALVEVSSARAGEDLTYFFDQWLNAAEVPEFDRVFQVYRTTDGYEVVGQLEQDLELFRMPVEIEVVTDGEPEFATIVASGQTTDLDIQTERKPRGLIIDPEMRVLRYSPEIRVKVHISRGEDLANNGQFNQAIDEYEQAVDLDRLNSLAYFRMGEAYFELGNLNAALQLFREALNGNLDPIWIEVWSYINMGKIYDLRQDRERAITEYQKALNTRDDAYGAQGEAERFVNEPFRGAADIF